MRVPQTGHDFAGDVGAAAEVVGQGGDGVDGPPRKAPPTQNQRQHREAEPRRHRTAPSRNEVDVARLLKCQQDHGNAVLLAGMSNPQVRYAPYD